MNRKQRQQIFERFAQQEAEPTTELHYRNNFELLIAVILSAQATDISVNRATGPLFERAPSPEAMYALGYDQLYAMIRQIGLAPTKTRNILATCHQLCTKHNGQVPDDREALEALAGVGRKTANVVLNTGFGHDTIAVDTHIFRVSNRTGLATGNTPLAVEQQLNRHVPKAYRRHAHHWLILHGRYVCKARKPHCLTCPINDLCQFRPKNLEPLA